MLQRCKVCGKKAYSDYCFAHKLRKPPEVTAKPLEDFQIREVADTVMLFKRVWKKRGPISELSGKPLGNRPSTMFFHHILYKSKYPQAMYDEDNIIIISGEEHANVHSSPERYEKINELREQLLKKYNIFD